MQQVSGNLVDIHRKEIYPATIFVENGIISDIKREDKVFSGYIIPGLIDAHVHIESSMLVPYEFGKAAMKHGTVATVSDPHEIANVLGIEGVKFMIENGKLSPLKFNWCAPSCVPATGFETSGAVLSASEIDDLLDMPEINVLAEMMNFPGVVYNDAEVMQKLSIAKQKHIPIDGHAPGLTGDMLKKYVDAGISTDHECTTLAEAVEKLNFGMKILIRNGSSAKNFDALAQLIDQYPDKVMLCCDDIHPEDLLMGHINATLKLGVQKGLNVFNLLRAVSINPILHYNLSVGMLRKGDRADFCIAENLVDFVISETWIDGACVFAKDHLIAEAKVSITPVNNFVVRKIEVEDISIPNEYRDFKAISVMDGELVTKVEVVKNIYATPFLFSDITNDILKIVVVNRYRNTKPAVGFVKNFGLKRGAIAGSVAHDSHNIIAVGTTDDEIVCAINAIMDTKGGIVAVCGNEKWNLPLPVAGLLSGDDAHTTAQLYQLVNEKAKEFGSTLTSPFMTLSFMALLVIPELKLSDKGLFDGNKFEFTSLFV